MKIELELTVLQNEPGGTVSILHLPIFGPPMQVRPGYVTLELAAEDAARLFRRLGAALGCYVE
jgi:hypothetical protein